LLGGELAGRAFAAVRDAVGYEDDREDLLRMGGAGRETYLNSGVMLMDLERWRDRCLMERALELAHGGGLRLRNWDQTLLNVIGVSEAVMLDARWNLQVLPWDPELRPSGAFVLHFLSAPKPWMFLGASLNRNSRFFAEEVSLLPLEARELVRKGARGAGWRQFWSARRLYWYLFRERMLQIVDPGRARPGPACASGPSGQDGKA
jgi:lipopolysaccharide biosynthesis glycosyltransferase